AREQRVRELRIAAPPGADLGARPTKRDRRRLEALRRGQTRRDEPRERRPLIELRVIAPVSTPSTPLGVALPTTLLARDERDVLMIPAARVYLFHTRSVRPAATAVAGLFGRLRWPVVVPRTSDTRRVPTEVEIRRLAPHELREHLDALAAVLRDCVEGGASVSYMAPFPQEEARAAFEGFAADAERGGRLILAAFADGELVGTVQVVLTLPP